MEISLISEACMQERIVALHKMNRVETDTRKGEFLQLPCNELEPNLSRGKMDAV